MDCPDLRRVVAHLQQGTRPSKRYTNIADVKRYLNMCSVNDDGLVIVRRKQPLAPTRDCIVVPRGILHGFLTSLHLTLDHPTKHQFKLSFKRSFHALNLAALTPTLIESDPHSHLKTHLCVLAPLLLLTSSSATARSYSSCAKL